jgi:hypothetical protein
MATIIHPPDPWGGPRFALDVFSSLITAWDRYQALQERKETRDLLNQQHALRMLEMVLGFPDDYLRSNPDSVNRLAKLVGLGPIVKETGEIKRPVEMDIRRQELQLRQQTYEAAQEAIKDPNVAKLAGEYVLGVTPRQKIEQEFGRIKEQLEIMRQIEEMRRQEERHPLEMERLRTEIKRGEAEIPHIQAETLEALAKTRLLEAQWNVLVSKGEETGNVKTFNIKWTDPETGETRQGVAIFNLKTGNWEIRPLDVIEQIDEQGNVKQVRVRSPEVQKEWEKIKQDAGKVWGRYVKDVLKGRDLDWTDEKEVKRFQDYLQASGFITKMQKIQKGRRAIYSIIIIDPSDPKQERPIHGFPSEAAEAMRTKMSLPQMFEDLYKVFGTGGP